MTPRRTSPGPPGTGLVAVSVSHASEDELNSFYDDLLVPAFPPAELLRREELHAASRQGVAGGGGTLLMRGDKPMAGMLIEEFAGGDVLLLAYLVVAVSARSSGLGGWLLSQLVRTASHGRKPMVLAEIDDPRLVLTSAHGDPVARVRFYERAGARLLPLPYAQPSLRPESPRVETMLLIALGAQVDDLDGRLVATCLEEYYRACEGESVLTDDPAVAGLIARARGDGHGRLRTAPLAQLDDARTISAPPAGAGKA